MTCFMSMNLEATCQTQRVYKRAKIFFSSCSTALVTQLNMEHSYIPNYFRWIHSILSFGATNSSSTSSIQIGKEIDCCNPVIEHSTDVYSGISHLAENLEEPVDAVDCCEFVISRKERMAEILSQEEPVLQGTTSHVGSKSPGVLLYIHTHIIILVIELSS